MELAELSSSLMDSTSADRLSTAFEMLPVATLVLSVPLVSSFLSLIFPFLSLNFASLTLLVFFRPSVPKVFLLLPSFSWAKTEARKLLKEAWRVLEFVPSKGTSENELMFTNFTYSNIKLSFSSRSRMS